MFEPTAFSNSTFVSPMCRCREGTGVGRWPREGASAAIWINQTPLFLPLSQEFHRHWFTGHRQVQAAAPWHYCPFRSFWVSIALDINLGCDSWAPVLSNLWHRCFPFKTKMFMYEWFFVNGYLGVRVTLLCWHCGISTWVWCCSLGTESQKGLPPLA